MVNQEKRWDWKHMLYDEMRNWAMWNCTKWLIWKICTEREKIDMKKIPRKGKDWIEKDAHKEKRLNWKRCPERKNIEIKKMSKWEKIVMRKMKNGLPIINLPI